MEKDDEKTVETVLLALNKLLAITKTLNLAPPEIEKAKAISCSIDDFCEKSIDLALKIVINGLEKPEKAVNGNFELAVKLLVFF